MKFSIGDKSSIFKYISKNLKNLYDANLKVSNEYTIDLAKCIYNFLKDNFPQQDIILSKLDSKSEDEKTISDIKFSISESIADYYLSGNSLVDYLTRLEPDKDYYYSSGKLTINNTQLNSDSVLYIYYSHNNIEYFVIDDFSLDNPVTNIYDNPDCINDVFVVDFSKYNKTTYTEFNIENITCIPTTPKYNSNSAEMGARLYIELPSSTKSKPIYDTNSSIITFSLDDINEFSLIDWPIDDQILQYLYPGVVVCNNFSDIDEIAVAQNLFIDADLQYHPEHFGVIDDNFTNMVYIIQYKLIRNKPVLATGYFDTYVESYVRNLCEVRV